MLPTVRVARCAHKSSLKHQTEFEDLLPEQPFNKVIDADKVEAVVLLQLRRFDSMFGEFVDEEKVKTLRVRTDDRGEKLIHRRMKTEGLECRE